VAGGKFTIRSRAGNILTAAGVVALLVFGFGGLFFLQASLKPNGTTTLIFVLTLGIITFLLFAGPGLLYPGRKRVAFLKKILPGGTMSWVRAHMYLPFLALLAAIVHGTSEPFRDNLSSGKVLLAITVLVVISGYFRHHMIGLQKEALNVNVEITKLTSGQSRHFRELVGDFLDNRRPMGEIEAEMASMDRAQQVLWARSSVWLSGSTPTSRAKAARAPRSSTTRCGRRSTRRSPSRCSSSSPSTCGMSSAAPLAWCIQRPTTSRPLSHARAATPRSMRTGARRL